VKLCICGHITTVTPTKHEWLPGQPRGSCTFKLKFKHLAEGLREDFRSDDGDVGTDGLRAV
jgi:hypothetical protein